MFAMILKLAGKWFLGPLLQLLEFGKRNPIIFIAVLAIAAAVFQSWRLASAKDKIQELKIELVTGKKNLRIQTANFAKAKEANASLFTTIEEFRKNLRAEQERSSAMRALSVQLANERDQFQLDLEVALNAVKHDVREIYHDHEDCAAWGAERMCPALIERLSGDPCEGVDC